MLGPNDTLAGYDFGEDDYEPGDKVPLSSEGQQAHPELIGVDLVLVRYHQGAAYQVKDPQGGLHILQVEDVRDEIIHAPEEPPEEPPDEER